MRNKFVTLFGGNDMMTLPETEACDLLDDVNCADSCEAVISLGSHFRVRRQLRPSWTFTAD